MGPCGNQCLQKYGSQDVNDAGRRCQILGKESSSKTNRFDLLDFVSHLQLHMLGMYYQKPDDIFHHFPDAIKKEHCFLSGDRNTT